MDSMGKSIGILMQCIKNALGSILDLKEITYNPFEMHENPDEIYWGSNRIPMEIGKVIFGLHSDSFIECTGNPIQNQYGRV